MSIDCEDVDPVAPATPKKIHHEMKKLETFIDKLRAQVTIASHDILVNTPELDAVTFTFVYKAELGNDVEPTVLSYHRDEDSPLLRARVAATIGQAAVLASQRVADGFRAAVTALKDITAELNAKRTAVKASAAQGEAASGGDTHTGGTA
jgi:hypothetical protein